MRLNNKKNYRLIYIQVLIKMAKKKKLINILFLKKKIYKNIKSSKVKINNYFNNEKAINDSETQLLKYK
jgi:hypothetical protein